MDYIKTVEKKLNNYNELLSETQILKQISKENETEINKVKNTLGGMESQERELIQRLFINGEKPFDIAETFEISLRTFYYARDKALKSFAKRLYGTSILENGGKK